MPRITITPEDVKRGKVVAPGWYLMTIRSVVTEVNKKGDANNYVVELVGNSGESAGVPFKKWFSEKAPGATINFIKAIGGSIDESGGDFELEAGVGQQVMVYIKNELYEGRMTNSVQDFRSKDAAV